MAPKVLVILTSHDKLGNTGKPTGWYLVNIHPVFLPPKSPEVLTRRSPN